MERNDAYIQELKSFKEFGKSTVETVTRYEVDGRENSLPALVNEYWTSKQRQANGLHEISYRACFKPQLPRFFIKRLTGPGDVVYDPFMGRGTTPLEAALFGRVPVGCDVNPLSRILLEPRLAPPQIEDVADRLELLMLDWSDPLPEELLVFYHETTLRRLCALKQYLLARAERNELDMTDKWIRMVAVNRLTGHSKGFFSVYTMPPNQAVSVQSQRKINERRKQTPPPRDIKALIVKKSRSLLRNIDSEQRESLHRISPSSLLITGASSNTSNIAAGSVSLVVTSPPFLDVVNYAGDNWLRCWFCGIDAASVPITMCTSIKTWSGAMTKVFVELFRVLKPGGHVAFEVGEVHKGKVRLEESVIPCGLAAGFVPLVVVINDQAFTKTAHCWGVDNKAKGTNTNRIVLFRKPETP